MKYLSVFLVPILFFLIKANGFSQEYSKEFNNKLLSENYGIALSILKNEYYEIVNNNSGIDIPEISKLYRLFVKLKDRTTCNGENDPKCKDKFLVNMASEFFIEKILQKRSQQKFINKDFYGAISDSEILIGNLDASIDENSEKLGESYLLIGSSYMLLEIVSKGCISLSKASEFGNSRANELLKKYCN